MLNMSFRLHTFLSVKEKNFDIVHYRYSVVKQISRTYYYHIYVYILLTD